MKKILSLSLALSLMLSGVGGINASAEAEAPSDEKEISISVNANDCALIFTAMDNKHITMPSVKVVITSELHSVHGLPVPKVMTKTYEGYTDENGILNLNLPRYYEDSDDLYYEYHIDFPELPEGYKFYDAWNGYYTFNLLTFEEFSLTMEFVNKAYVSDDEYSYRFEVTENPVKTEYTSSDKKIDLTGLQLNLWKKNETTGKEVLEENFSGNNIENTSEYIKFRIGTLDNASEGKNTISVYYCLHNNDTAKYYNIYTSFDVNYTITEEEPDTDKYSFEDIISMSDEEMNALTNKMGLYLYYNTDSSCAAIALKSYYFLNDDLTEEEKLLYSFKLIQDESLYDKQAVIDELELPEEYFGVSDHFSADNYFVESKSLGGDAEESYFGTAVVPLVYLKDTVKETERAKFMKALQIFERMNPRVLQVKPCIMPAHTVYGDADGNGELEINDAVKLMAYINNPAKYPLSAVALDNADVYNRGDGIDNMDALAVQKRLAGVINTLPVSYRNASLNF